MRWMHTTIRGRIVPVGMAVFAYFSAVAQGNDNNITTVHSTRLIQTQSMADQADTPTITLLSAEQIASHIKASEPDSLPQPFSNYPVDSVMLTPGGVESHVIDVQLMQPIFIVGDDDRSKAWLKKYQEKLIALQAKGFVVNVKSADAMKTFQSQFPTLPMLAIPGDAVAQWLGLSHYPALISNHLIEQ
ncbi:MAG: integrating conjugative element protein [Gammaproteobacteria bacterium]|nr:integrating conjugative element protein [Gammaproteobacteria bacterium]